MVDSRGKVRTREVVGGVGGDEEDGLADLRQLRGQGAGRRGLPNTPFSTDKDPAERLLLQDVLKRRRVLLVHFSQVRERDGTCGSTVCISILLYLHCMSTAYPLPIHCIFHQRLSKMQQDLLLLAPLDSCHCHCLVLLPRRIDRGRLSPRRRRRRGKPRKGLRRESQSTHPRT
jgi:hypothetical protein